MTIYKKQIDKYTSSKTILKIIIAIIASISLAGILAAVLCMIFSKPIGDDFGAIYDFRPEAWLSYSLDLLMRTGRYGQAVSASLSFGLFRQYVTVALPLIVLAWLIVISFKYVSHFYQRFLISKKKDILLLSSFSTATLCFALLFVGQNVYTDAGLYPTWLSFQVFFWAAGIITYPIALLFLATIYYLLYVKRCRLGNKTKAIILCASIFLAGLSNETQPVTIVAIALAIYCASRLRPFIKLAKLRNLCLYMLIPSALAIVTMLLSKGNQERQVATGVQNRDMINVLFDTCKNLYISFAKIYFQPDDVVLLVGLGLIVALFIGQYSKLRKPQLAKMNQSILVGGIISLLALPISLVCSFLLIGIGYGENSGIVARTLLLPQLFFVLSALLLSYSFWIFLFNNSKENVKRILLGVMLFLLLFNLPAYAIRFKDQLLSSARYYRAWQIEESKINEQKSRGDRSTVYLPDSVSGLGVGQNLSCKTGWLHKQIEDYFDIEQVCSERER